MKTIVINSRKACLFLLFTATATLIIVNNTYSGIVTTNGLVGYWTGDNTANDLSGNAHHGALFNGATFAPGLFGQAFSFSGNNEYVSVPNHPDLQLTTGFTISAWVKTSSFSDDAGKITPIVHMDSQSSGDRGYSFGVDTNGDIQSVIFQDGTGFSDSQRISDVSLNLGQFHHIVTVYEGGVTPQLNIFIDGMLHNGILNLDLGSISSSIFASSQPLIFGSYVSGIHPFPKTFDGLIDDIAIYNRALTESEILATFSTGNPAIPEPSTFFLMILGIFSLTYLERYRKRKTTN